MQTYRFYTDPGHGWLAVPRTELARLGLIDKISQFSYQKGKTVYLEEDCDARVFTKAKDMANEPYKFDYEHTDKNHWIRGYRFFAA